MSEFGLQQLARAPFRVLSSADPMGPRSNQNCANLVSFDID